MLTQRDFELEITFCFMKAIQITLIQIEDVPLKNTNIFVNNRS
jgi:hypothetical protein